jgi:hypothetical protein
MFPTNELKYVKRASPRQGAATCLSGCAVGYVFTILSSHPLPTHINTLPYVTAASLSSFCVALSTVELRRMEVEIVHFLDKRDLRVHGNLSTF